MFDIVFYNEIYGVQDMLWTQFHYKFHNIFQCEASDLHVLLGHDPPPPSRMHQLTKFDSLRPQRDKKLIDRQTL